MFHHYVKPGLAFHPGGDRCVDADDIGLTCQLERDPLVKATAQLLGAKGDKRATKTGNVETLGRGVEGDRAGGDFRPERCKGDVLLARKNQVGVDLVGNDDEVALDDKMAQCKQLVTGEQ